MLGTPRQDGRREPASDIVAGVDLGGTKIGTALVDADGRHRQIETVPSAAKDGPQAVLDAVADAVRTVLYPGRPARLRAVRNDVDATRSRGGLARCGRRYRQRVDGGGGHRR
ncbi:MAG: ROK family protein [Ornithinimicrobium sp.]|uniref:ROK family protein n=1 Tax=Ornithinimicrobium sp. TaxID=1977084 RepID=UPI003D9BD17F